MITALNEEAVAAAALANKGAEPDRQLRGIRGQDAWIDAPEIIFARRQKELGQPPGWISVPLIVTSHTWENSKNEQSPGPDHWRSIAGEMSDTARVLFPVDENTACAALRAVYASRGQSGGFVVVSKRDTPNHFSAAAAQSLIEHGAAHVAGDPSTAQLQFVAIGAYQLEEALKAHARLEHHGLASCITVVVEPGRLRIPRTNLRPPSCSVTNPLQALFPPHLPRVLISHTRPEPMLGVLRRIDSGPSKTRALGYINHGGTLDVAGMLIANRCTWVDAIYAAAQVTGWNSSQAAAAATDA